VLPDPRADLSERVADLLVRACMRHRITAQFRQPPDLDFMREHVFLSSL